MDSIMIKPMPILGSWRITIHLLVWCFALSTCLARIMFFRCGFMEDDCVPVGYFILLVLTLGITGALALPVTVKRLGQHLKARQPFLAFKAFGVALVSFISVGYFIGSIGQMVGVLR